MGKSGRGSRVGKIYKMRQGKARWCEVGENVNGQGT